MSKKEIKEREEEKMGQRRKNKLLIDAEERNTHRDIKMLRKQAVQLRNQLFQQLKLSFREQRNFSFFSL